MLSAPLSTFNIIKRHRKTTFQSQESREGASTYRFDSARFPLHFRSKDLLSFWQDDEDPELYLQILQEASSPTTEPNKFEEISPEIANRLDKSQGAGPLHYASINGNLSMATFLLKNDAQVNIWDTRERVTPLICAAAHGHVAVMKLLLEHGANIDAGLNGSNEEQYSALIWAVRKSHFEAVQLLLETNAGQISKVPYCETPLHAAVISDSPEILKLLLEKHNNGTVTNFQMGPEKNSPLHLAVSAECKNSYKLCKLLLEELEDENVDVNSLNSKRKTPLHEAAASHNLETINLLLAHGAELNAVDEEGKTPLFYAISDDDESINCIAGLVGRLNCNVNHQDNWGNTPLHIAGLHQDAGAVEILLLNGADFSIRTYAGASALSILRKNIPSTYFLLKKSFDQAVTLMDRGRRQKTDCSNVKVDLAVVLPTPLLSKNDVAAGDELEMVETKRCSTVESVEENDRPQIQTTRRETSKIKCLMDEEYSRLLLHPVIHSFLELKWGKARKFYLPKLILKFVMADFFINFIGAAYWLSDNDLSKCEETNVFITTWYPAIVVMALINLFTELVEILRAPKQQLKSLDPWLFATVCVVLYLYWPEKCGDMFNFHGRALGAWAILLVWVDVWITMARFPRVGLTIRVFLKVLKNFILFVLSQACLLIGFGMSLCLLFQNKSNEYSNFAHTIPKLVRVMAGDITMIDVHSNSTFLNEVNSSDIVWTNYLYTVYVLTVAIVMMNLLIGLAVKDIQELYADASMDILVKQSLMIGILESSLSGKFMRACRLNGFFGRYVNLFSSNYSEKKTISFNAHDPSDTQLSSEQKKALFNIASVNAVNSSQKKRRSSVAGGSIRRLSLSPNYDVFQKLSSVVSTDDNDEKRVLLEGINAVLLTYFESISSKN